MGSVYAEELGLAACEDESWGIFASREGLLGEGRGPYVFDSSEERRNRHSKLNIFKSMPPMKVNESENIF